jgi:hypothetical protein
LQTIQSETPNFSAKQDGCDAFPHGIDPQELLIDDDLNDLLDREIRPINDEAEWGLWDKNQLKGGSTHVSVMHKSPLDAYTDQSDCRHAFTCHPS